MESLHSDLTLKVVECAEECYSRVTVQLQWKTCEKFGIQDYSWKPCPGDHSKDWKGGVFWGQKRFDYIPQVKNCNCNALPKTHQFKIPEITHNTEILGRRFEASCEDVIHSGTHNKKKHIL